MKIQYNTANERRKKRMKIVIDIPDAICERFGCEYSEQNLISKEVNESILDAFCNGTPLPKGHGRLGDLDALEKEMTNGIKAGLYEEAGLLGEGYETFTHINNVDDCVDCVRYADTIIEADKDDERMKITLEIPKEFEEHFKNDRFKESLHRLSADVHSLAGNYEREVVTMLIDAFRNAEILEEKEQEYIEQLIRKDKPLPVYLEGDGYSDGELVYDTAICENCNERYEIDYDEHYKYCPNCGQRLDWSEVDNNE